MFVITADQRDSRHDADRVDDAIARLTADRPDDLVLPPERTAGDEFQCVLESASAVVPLVLALHRSGHWSIGLGIGSVERPLPRTIRAATGDAFFAARRAVESAKTRPARFALDPDARAGSFPSVPDAQALFDPLLHLRDARSDAGWEIIDLLAAGRSQKEAAAQLSVTPQAVSLRVRAASGRVDGPAADALVRLLTVVDRTLDPTDGRTER